MEDTKPIEIDWTAVVIASAAGALAGAILIVFTTVLRHILVPGGGSGGKLPSPCGDCL